jgi:hypothetical protein
VLHTHEEALKAILSLDLLSDEVILILVLLGILDELFNVLLGETTLVVGDGDLGILGGSLIGSGDVHDTVLVDLERDLDLGHTTRSRRNTVKVELAQDVVVLGKLTLAFVHLNQHTGLVIGIGGKDLRLLGWDSRVPGNQICHNTTSCLDTERQRANIDQQQAVNVFVALTSQDGSLDGSSISNGLIRVDRAVGLLSVVVLL